MSVDKFTITRDDLIALRRNPAWIDHVYALRGRKASAEVKFRQTDPNDSSQFAKLQGALDEIDFTLGLTERLEQELTETEIKDELEQPASFPGRDSEPGASE